LEEVKIYQLKVYVCDERIADNWWVLIVSIKNVCKEFSN